MTKTTKRIMKELKEFQINPDPDFTAYPVSYENLFQWHFTISGPPDTEFAGGIYHGRIILPQDYPFKTPDIILLTPNGRFELGRKICLSISNFHPEQWQPAWGIRTVLIAVRALLPTPCVGALGSLDFPKDERRRLAKKSRSWRCDSCVMRMDEAFLKTIEPTSFPKDTMIQDITNAISYLETPNSALPNDKKKGIIN